MSLSIKRAGWPAFWDNFAQDARYTFRRLRREPGFFAIAILIIALGVGATTAIFSVVNAVLLRPLPFRDPERLVRVANTQEGGLSGVTSRSSNLRDWRRLAESFDDLAGYFAFFDYGSYKLVGSGEPERLVGVGVTQNFLDLLGVSPQLGRGFVDEECVWNGRPAALLTAALWRRRFGSDPSIVGKTINLNGEATSVVGILPAEFDFASLFSPGSRIDLLVPFSVSDETDRWGNTLAVIGRLKPNVTITAAQKELDAINRRLKEEDPKRWGLGAAVSGLHEHVTERFRRPLIVLACAVGLVLLIACANLSNLLLARAASRRTEIAIRGAIGAGRGRLVRQMLTESLALSAIGAGLGVLVALAVTRGVSATRAFSIPLLQSVQIDRTALLFAIVVALLTGLLFGIVPALQSSKTGAYEALRESGRGSTEGRGRSWTRSALVVSEVALACVLLVGAGLLLRSFVSLLDVDLGFLPDQATAWRVDVGDKYPEHADRVAFYERLVRAFQTMPGVESVGLTDTLPLGRNRTWGVAAKGVEYEEGTFPIVFPRMIDRGYIHTMRIPLLEGREFDERDTLQSPKVILVNQAMARRLWPGKDAVGQTVVFFAGDHTVVGVVANVRHSSLEEAGGLEMYVPITQNPNWGAIDVVVRSKLPVASLAPQVGATLRDLDPTVPTGDYQTLDEIVERALSPRRFILLLLGAFASMALFLAALGIYGVISYSVNQRTQEFGIRMALGASAAHVRLSVIRKTLALALAGIVLGAIGSIAVARLMASLLYGVAPADPLTFAGMATVLALIAVLAGYVPARRASRVDPMTALRAS